MQCTKFLLVALAAFLAALPAQVVADSDSNMAAAPQGQRPSGQAPTPPQGGSAEPTAPQGQRPGGQALSATDGDSGCDHHESETQVLWGLCKSNLK